MLMKTSMSSAPLQLSGRAMSASGVRVGALDMIIIIIIIVMPPLLRSGVKVKGKVVPVLN
jgi:hypothetical protein